MKYYYYFGNQRYVSDKLNLDQCKSVMFKLERVDEDGVGLGIFNIVTGGELVGANQTCKDCDSTHPCLYRSGCWDGATTAEACVGAGGTWCLSLIHI